MATKRYNFKFHCLKDKDIIDRIDSQENKQNYIRGLILSDIAADILRDSIQLGEDPDKDPEDDRIADPFRFRCWVREKVCMQLLYPNDPNGCNACPYQYNVKEDGSFDCRIESMSIIELEELIDGKL